MNARNTAFEKDVVLTEVRGVDRLNSLAISATATGGVASLAFVFGVVFVTAGA